MYQYFKYSNSLLFPFDRCRRVASGLLISEVQAFLQKPSSIIIILIFVNRTLRRIKSSRLIGLVLHAVTLIFFKEHPSHSALCCDISVELSPFAVKSMFWLRSGPITWQEITYPDLVVPRTDYGMPRGHSLSIYERFNVYFFTSKRGTTIFFSHYNLFPGKQTKKLARKARVNIERVYRILLMPPVHPIILLKSN